MPATPLTPDELDELIAFNITDELLMQNTAERVREVLLSLRASSYNRLTDALSTGGTGGAVDAYTKAQIDRKLADLKLTAQPVTYAQLVALRDTAKLKPGNFYKLTYTLTHTIPNTSVLHTAAPEELLLLASGNSTINPHGYSLTYPSDEVTYSLENNTTRMPGCTEGFVSRRHDTVQANDLEIDFRNVVVRRWLIPLPSPDYDNNTEGYYSATDNGAAFRDVPMFQDYPKVLNNYWRGFDFRFRRSIFDNINFTAGTRVLNTTVTNSGLRGVTFGEDTWFIGSNITGGDGLQNVQVPRLSFLAYLRVSMLNSAIQNRTVVEDDMLTATLIASTLSNEVLSGKTYIANQIGGGGSTQQQISSQPGHRTLALVLLQPLALDSIVAVAANNVSSYALQVNLYANGAWMGGTPRTSLAAAQADLDALTTFNYTAGAELEITTVAADDTADAILIVSYHA